MLILLLGLFAATITAQDTYSDTFGSVSYAKNDGTQNFSTNWSEYNDNNSASNRYMRIWENQVYFDFIWNETIGRSAGQSGYTSATFLLIGRHPAMDQERH